MVARSEAGSNSVVGANFSGAKRESVDRILRRSPAEIISDNFRGIDIEASNRILSHRR